MPDDTIHISRDGNQWRALRGENSHTGQTGFGLTPKNALDSLFELDARNEEYRAIKEYLSNPMDCTLGGATCGSCGYLSGGDCLRYKIREVFFGGI